MLWCFYNYCYYYSILTLLNPPPHIARKSQMRPEQNLKQSFLQQVISPWAFFFKEVITEDNKMTEWTCEPSVINILFFPHVSPHRVLDTSCLTWLLFWNTSTAISKNAGQDGFFFLNIQNYIFKNVIHINVNRSLHLSQVDHKKQKQSCVHNSNRCKLKPIYCVPHASWTHWALEIILRLFIIKASSLSPESEEFNLQQVLLECLKCSSVGSRKEMMH